MAQSQPLVLAQSQPLRFIQYVNGGWGIQGIKFDFGPEPQNILNRYLAMDLRGPGPSGPPDRKASADAPWRKS